MTLTFDLESGVRVMCDVATSVPILVFLGLSVLGPMYATDRRQTASSLNAPAYKALCVRKTTELEAPTATRCATLADTGQMCK